MIYLYGYLGIGFVVIAIVYGAHKLQKKDALREMMEQIEAASWSRITRLAKFLESFVVGVVVVVVWPVALCMVAKEAFARNMHSETKTQSAPDMPNEYEEPGEFVVKRHHILDRLTVQQLEAREVVVDPLQAAPELPFGHLNEAWKEFFSGLPKGCELWSFSAPTRSVLRTGYVAVQSGAPGAYFLTMHKEISE